jgi:hypothetical protein
MMTNRGTSAKPDAPRYVFTRWLLRERPMTENAMRAALRRIGCTKEEMPGHGFCGTASTARAERSALVGVCVLVRYFLGVVTKLSAYGAIMQIEGGCHCGYIVYEAGIDPEKVGICHCTDCQTLTGSAFTTAVPAAKETFSLRTGQLRIYVKTAESGAKRAQAYSVLNADADLCGRRGRSTDIQHPGWNDTPAERIAVENTILMPVCT